MALKKGTCPVNGLMLKTNILKGKSWKCFSLAVLNLGTKQTFQSEFKTMGIIWTLVLKSISNSAHQFNPQAQTHISSVFVYYEQVSIENSPAEKSKLLQDFLPSAFSHGFKSFYFFCFGFYLSVWGLWDKATGPLFSRSPMNSSLQRLCAVIHIFFSSLYITYIQKSPLVIFFYPLLASLHTLLHFSQLSHFHD